MFYANRTIYYTLSGNKDLFSRSFSPDTATSSVANQVTGGVISPHKITVVPASGTVDFSDASGMFVANGFLWYATKADGTLHKVAVERHDVHGPSSVDASATGNWAGKAVFVSPVAPPVAADGELHRVLPVPRRASSTPRPRRPPARRSPRTPGTSVTATPAPASRRATPTALRRLPGHADGHQRIRRDRHHHAAGDGHRCRRRRVERHCVCSAGRRRAAGDDRVGIEQRHLVVYSGSTTSATAASRRRARARCTLTTPGTYSLRVHGHRTARGASPRASRSRCGRSRPTTPSSDSSPGGSATRRPSAPSCSPTSPTWPRTTPDVARKDHFPSSNCIRQGLRERHPRPVQVQLMTASMDEPTDDELLLSPKGDPD